MLSFRFKWIFNYCIPVPLVPWTPLSPSAPILIYTPTWLLRRTLYGKNISSKRTLKNPRSISFSLSLSTLQAFYLQIAFNWLLVLPYVQYKKLSRFMYSVFFLSNSVCYTTNAERKLHMAFYPVHIPRAEICFSVSCRIEPILGGVTAH